MTHTYDPTTDRGYVRLLVTDTAVTDPETVIFSDAEIDAFIAREGTVLFAAAAALETIASSEVLIQKKLSILGGDLSTDGPAEADALRQLAATMRTRGGTVSIDPTTEDESGFEIAEMVINDFQYRERVLDDVMRGA